MPELSSTVVSFASRDRLSYTLFMATAEPPTEINSNGPVPEAPPVNTAVTAISIMHVHTWSDQGLSLTNSVAGIAALISAAVLLGSLALLYFSGHELSVRVSRAIDRPEPAAAKTSDAGDRRNGSSGEKTARDERKVARLTRELSEARLAAEARRADLAKVERELAAAQKSDKIKTERVARLENDFATVKRSEEEKGSRVSQLEEQLGKMRKAEVDRTSRLTQLEKDLETARKASSRPETDTAAAAAENGRTITPAQREQFRQTVKGHATGKVIVSAFFENKETHDFGQAIIALLKSAGFEVIEQAPVNFFTTSRPSSGVRIGCEDMAHPPSHFLTIRKGFEAMGIQIPDTSVVNAQEPDVVEVQITPKE
jgi:hypothetical protein